MRLEPNIPHILGKYWTTKLYPNSQWTHANTRLCVVNETINMGVVV